MVRQTWRHFAFNIQNFTPEDLQACQLVTCKYICFQEEIGELNGVHHLQGYVYFSDACRVAAARKRLGGRAHIDICDGTPAQNREYCIKVETKVFGTFVERGKLPVGQGNRSDIDELHNALRRGDTKKQIWAEHFGRMWFNPRSVAAYYADHPIVRTVKPYVMVLCGPTGTGKTTTARQLATDYYPLSYGKTGLWWDGYDPAVHKHVVMDEYYGHWMPYNLLLTILDGHPVYVDTKGGRIALGNIEKIFITSNCPMDQWYRYNDTNMQFPALQRRVSELWWVEKDFWTPGTKPNPPPPLFIEPKNILLGL